MSLRRSLALALASVSFVSSAWASPHVLKPGESYSELSLGLTSAESYFRDSDSKSWTLGGTFEQRVLEERREGVRDRVSEQDQVPRHPHQPSAEKCSARMRSRTFAMSASSSSAVVR